jgi:hypothetical protein
MILAKIRSIFIVCLFTHLGSLKNLSFDLIGIMMNLVEPMLLLFVLRSHGKSMLLIGLTFLVKL